MMKCSRKLLDELNLLGNKGETYEDIIWKILKKELKRVDLIEKKELEKEFELRKRNVGVKNENN